MEHYYFDEYSRNQSIISRLDPRIKIITFLAFIFFIIFTSAQNIYSFAYYGLILIMLTIFAKIPFLFILKRILTIIPFAIMVAIFMPFLKGGTPIARWRIAQIHFTISREGVLIFWNCFIKAVLSASCLAILGSTTKFADLLKGLIDLKMPKIIIMVLSFMYRYIFLAEDQMMKIKYAVAARSCARPKIRAFSGRLSVFFIHVYEKAEMVYIAMCARGFTGDIKTLDAFRIKPQDIAFMLIIIALLTFIKSLTGGYG